MASTARRGPSATNFFHNIERTFSGLNDKLEKSVRDHLRNVYATLAVGIASAMVGAAVHLFTDMLRGGFLLSIVSIGLMFALMTTPHSAANMNKRMGYFVGFCFISGISMGPLLSHVLDLHPTVPFTAFMGTMTVFGCFSLAALHAESTKFLHMGGMLMSALMTMLLFSVFSFVLPSVIIPALLWAGLALNCAFVLYDTQMIIEKNRRGDNDFIWHSVDLFIDFIQIFKHLMVLLSQKEERRGNRKRDD